MKRKRAMRKMGEELGEGLSKSSRIIGEDKKRNWGKRRRV